MKALKDFIPHLSIALLLGVVVLVILDGHNPLLMFLTSSVSKVFIICMAVVGIITAIIAICNSQGR